MISNQESFKSFIRLLEVPTEESLNEAIQKINEFPEVGEVFATKSPKFVEIFSHLQPGVTKRKIAVKFYQIISSIFNSISDKPDKFFRNLNYLADAMIRRHLDFLVDLMVNKKSKISLHVLNQAAKVHTQHCRDLFTIFDFSNAKFRDFISKEGKEEYLDLATTFLRNPDLSSTFLATKYSLSPMWVTMSQIDFSIAKPFIEAMIVATKKLNQSTKRWVFNDMTLKSLTKYIIDYNERDTASHAMYKLLQSIMEGPNSIILEDPQRTYCYYIQDIDPSPKNTHILVFIRDLKVWKKQSHRELAIHIFKQSPDLIGRYLYDQHRNIDPNLDLITVSSLLFLGKVVELDWPEFLPTIGPNFFIEKRSLDLLFESILPSVLKNSQIETFFQSSSILLRREMIKLLIKSVLKFLKLPTFLKTQDTYTKFRGRIPRNLHKILVESAESESLFPFALKLLILLDQVFPFFVSDSFAKEPSFISKFEKYSAHNQILILRLIPLLKNPLPQIKNLCSHINNESISNMSIKKMIYETVIKVIEKSDTFTGFEREIPVFVGEALNKNASSELFELIVLIKDKLFKFIGDDSTVSPAVFYLQQQKELANKNKNNKEMNDKKTNKNSSLLNCPTLVNLMNGVQVNKEDEIDLSPTVIMANLKWFSLENAAILLCSAIANNTTDLDLTLNCLTVVVSCDPSRTLNYVLNHPFIRSSVFRGSATFDLAISNFIVWNKVCDDQIAQSFLTGNVTDEVLDKISPFIPTKFTNDLLQKLMKNKHSIRNVLTKKDNNEYDMSKLTPFWQWAFKGFEPINISVLSPHITRKIKDEMILLDLLRTIWITNDSSLVKHIQIEEFSNKRLMVFASEILPEYQNIHFHYMPVCFLKKTVVDDPLSIFEKTNKEWSFDFLLNQIKRSDFVRRSSRISKKKVEFVVKFYLQNPSDTLLKTFEKILLHYLKKHPEVVETAPRYPSELFERISNESLLVPSKLVLKYDVSQFEGIANILLGTSPANVHIPLRVVLYLATGLSANPSFYRLVEHARISPASFLFATGEVAKVVIQNIDSKTKIYPASLCRNASYLAPFHLISHQQKKTNATNSASSSNSVDNVGDNVVEIDTPHFRFLLHFAHYLLMEASVPLENYMESGAPSVLFRALSSKDEHTRNVAYSALSELYDLNMKKKKEYSFHCQLQLLLESVINAVTTPGMRFTSLVTYFLSMAASIILKPSHTVFYTLIQFLASDRALRVNSAPLFSSLFGQSSLEHRAQRSWLLKMLKNGVCEASDVDLLKKGKVIERLCAFFASPLSDMASRKMILEILMKASKTTKLEGGVMLWAYSLITENFAAPHVDQLVALALSIRSKDEVEKMLEVNVARLAWSEFRESLDVSKEKVDRILCSASHQI